MITIIGISDNENFQRNDYLKGGETDYRILLNSHRPEEEKKLGLMFLVPTMNIYGKYQI